MVSFCRLPRCRPLLALALVLDCGIWGCGGGGGGSHTGPSEPPVPPHDRVLLVILENHSLGQVIGNSAMPFLNSLAAQNALATNYFANAHGSIADYFMLTIGLIETTNNDFTGVISDDNVVRALNRAGKTWKGYFGSLPSVGYIGGDVSPYLKHHNPFAYLTDVIDSPDQAGHLVPMTQLMADLGSGALPNFGLLVPDVFNDAHSCPAGATNCKDNDELAAADSWLQNNVAPVISSPKFGNGLVIITWDEGVDTDVQGGGGQVATIFAGPHVKPGFRSTTMFQHQDTLRTILDALQVSDHPNMAAGALPMGEFFR